MTKRTTILTELSELNSSLVNHEAQNIYTVPEGYFETLAPLMMRRIKALDASNAAEELSHLSPLLSSASKQMLYQLPVGYFENLEEQLIWQIKSPINYKSASEEISSISPLLSGLQKKNTYTVPDNYFKPAVQTIPAKKETAKVVSSGNRKWFRYAAAAAVVGIIATASVFIFKNKTSSEDKAEARLKTELHKMDDSALDELVEEFTDAGLNSKETVQSDAAVKKDEVKELLKDVSDTELEDFMKDVEDAVPENDDEILLN
jgi:hypothetical protein